MHDNNLLNQNLRQHVDRDYRNPRVSNSGHLDVLNDIFYEHGDQVRIDEAKRTLDARQTSEEHLLLSMKEPLSIPKNIFEMKLNLM